MIIEDEIPRFFDWLFGPNAWWEGSLFLWVLVGLCLAVGGIVLSGLFAIISRGPGPGLRSVGQRLREGTQDLLSTSPRRVFALSQLAVQEAVRHKVFVVFGLYILVMLALAWFLDPAKGTQPAKLYLGTVLFWTGLLVILVGMFLACFSLPADISNHTIYTVVTKPTRPTEIVLGRIFGFTAIGSIMLLVMSVVNYFFVTRSLDHQHIIRGAALNRVPVTDGSDDYIKFVGKTNKVDGHAHGFELRIAEGDARSRGKTESVHEHYHNILEQDAERPRSGKVEGCESASADGSEFGQIRIKSKSHGVKNGDLVKITGVRGTIDANSSWVADHVTKDTFELKQSQHTQLYEGGGTWRTIRYEVGGTEDMLIARVPVHAARMQFRDRDGNIKDEGTKVGFEWDYRGHVEGGTKGAAILHFRGLHREMFRNRGDGVKLEMKLSIYRTHKGDFSPLVGRVTLVNPDPAKGGFRSDKSALEFKADKEFSTLTLPLPDRIPGRTPGSQTSDTEANLFDDYVANGRGRDYIRGGRKIPGRYYDGELIVEVGIADRKIDRMQYLGVAKHDVYFVADQAKPFVNFMKGHLSIWLQMTLVISFGVMFSSFLNGFVALLATLAITVGSYYQGFIYEIIDPNVIGGSAIESAYRVLNRSPMTTDLPPGLATDVILFLDSGVRAFLSIVVQGIPNMSRLSSANYVSQGFSIPWNNLAIQFVTVIGFLIPLCLLAHYIIKGRELAR